MAYRRTERVQARLDAQRSALIRAAADLLAEDGYAGCTIGAVAARAGVANGTVYTHFGNKSELAAEVFRTIVVREVDAVRSAVASGSAADRVSAVVDTFAGRALKSPRRAYALLAEPVDPAVDLLRLEYRRAYRDVIADAIEAGIVTGELPSQNAAVVAAALVGAIGEALVGPLAPTSFTTPVDSETVPSLVLFALRAIGSTDRADA